MVIQIDGGNILFSHFRPVRSTIQIWVLRRHQYGTPPLFSFFRRYFAGKPVMAWRNVGCFVKLGNVEFLEDHVTECCAPNQKTA